MSGAIGKGKKLKVIEKLTEVKSKSKSKAATLFKKNISALEEAISKNNMDGISNYLNYFEKALRSSEMFDQKDLVVKAAIKSVDETRAKIELKPKSGRDERVLPIEGLKGEGVAKPSKTTPLDSSTWLSECIRKIANWLKNTDDEVLQMSFSDCHEKFESVQQDLSIIKGELERLDNLRKTERKELSSKLKELYSTLKQIDKTALDQKKIVTSTSDPDDKVVNDIKSLFIDVCQRNRQIKQKSEVKQNEQGQDLRNNETLERQIGNIVQNINEDEYTESDNGFQNPLDENVQTIRDTLRRQSAKAEERMALVRLYEEEINKLQEDTYDTEGVRTRMKEVNSRITDALISIRRRLEESPDKQNEHARLEITRLKQNLKETKEENENLVLRLSRVASAALSDNNPNIADLSDPNRPTKIGEKYKEIYDTEWTDAYECFHTMKGQDENKICSTLVKILEDAETYCTVLANLQQNHIMVQLVKPNDPKATPSKKTSDEKAETVLEAIHSKMINDLRKQTSHKSVEYVMKSFIQQVKIPQKVKEKEAVMKFLYKCAEICWYMSLQTPPVVLAKLGKTETKFNKDEYTEYTQKGSKVDFVTWPPLLLHEGGSLLCKGVAQGKD